MLFRFFMSFAAGVVLAAAPALAETRIVSITPQQVLGGPVFAFVNGIPKALTRDGGTTVGDNYLTENTIYIFPEAQGVTLTSVLRPGNGPLIPSGTKVDSFYLCIDTVDKVNNTNVRSGFPYSGTVTFDNTDLLAVVLRPPQLKTTAALLGKPGITYANTRFTGVDPFRMGQDDHSFAQGTFRFSGEANGIDCRRLIFRARD